MINAKLKYATHALPKNGHYEIKELTIIGLEFRGECYIYSKSIYK